MVIKKIKARIVIVDFRSIIQINAALNTTYVCVIAY